MFLQAYSLSSNQQTRLLQSVAERLQKMLLRYLDISCVIGLAQSDAQPESLSRAAREAAAAVQNRFWTDNIIVTAEYQHMEQSRNCVHR